MSKGFSMAGWRIGFAVGNKQLIAAMTRVKSYLDYGAFTPIQAAACAALNGPQYLADRGTTDNAFRASRDRLPVPAGPGLGVTPDAQAIQTFTQAAPT